MLIKTQTLTNTEFERLALSNRINFSDGHARSNFSANQVKILNEFQGHVNLALSKNQIEIESDFIKHFLLCGSQSFFNNDFNIFLNYSSSCAIKIAAQTCRKHDLKVLLIEPCFDNIRHILNTEQVPVTSIRESQIADLNYLRNNLDETTALWIVQPNNPTGFCLNEETFKEVIEIITEKKATLIVDFCFRFYSTTLKDWNQYQYLSNHKTSFISIEDTGKTWTLLDNKVGITTCSVNFNNTIHSLHDELLLNVSPLQLILLTEFIKDTITIGFQNTFMKDVEINRSYLNLLIDKEILSRATIWYKNVPMELLKVPVGIQAIKLWEELRKKGVDILPAANYFWTIPNEGSELFRIPLARPTQDFEIAIPIIESTITSLLSK
jgi:aspartate/methionine/tyrosine aminotransferase